MTRVSDDATATHSRTAPSRSGRAALVAALGFVAFYLITDFVGPSLASSSLPLPNDPVSEARDWFADNQLAAVMMAASQAVSVLFLAWFTIAIDVPRARPWGFAAVALMLLSSVCSWVLAGVAAGASLGAVDALRTASFIAGGTAHVLALGVFVFVAAKADGFGRAVRVLSVVSLVVCVLSLSSLLVFQGSAFILLGRLLCMIWAVSAGVSLARRGRTQ
jgi:hypothetical protein